MRFAGLDELEIQPIEAEQLKTQFAEFGDAWFPDKGADELIPDWILAIFNRAVALILLLATLYQFAAPRLELLKNRQQKETKEQPEQPEGTVIRPQFPPAPAQSRPLQPL